ncbi:MAG TPA: hypothetical protein DHV42_08655, partial [Lachnospiraceae bacterium]|nr:hypothetical protein [Lachnospiraceae bacterium]
PETALQLLMIGPEYCQAAVKSEKALSRLRWSGAERISRFDQKQMKKEQDDYQEQFAKAMNRLM